MKKRTVISCCAAVSATICSAVCLSSCGNGRELPAGVSRDTDSLALHYSRDVREDWLGVGLWGIPLPYDWDGDGVKDLLVSCPDTPYKGLYLYINEGTPSRPFFSKAVRISATGKNNIRLSEMDGVSRVLSAGKEYPDFFTAPYADEKALEYEGEKLGAGYKKSRSNMWNYADWDGDGDADIIVGIDTWDDYGWDNAYSPDGVWKNGPLHGYVYLLENRDGKYVNAGRITGGGYDIDVYGAPCPCVADFDSDGDLDIICGEFIDGLTWFENTGDRKNPVLAAGKSLANEDGEIRLHLQMIVPVVSDFDSDGFPDLVVGDEDGRVAWIRNTGKTGADGMPLFENPQYLRQEADIVKFGALSTPHATDWDGDGVTDLISGNSAGEIAFIRNCGSDESPAWEAPRLFKVDGTVFRTMAGSNGSIQGPAEAKWGYTVLTTADWDSDGLQDIIINSISGRIEWLRNTGADDFLSLEAPRPVEVEWNGAAPAPEWNWWKPAPGELVTQWRTTPVAMDWNNDGLVDLVMVDHEGYLAFYERAVSDDGSLKLLPGKRIFKGTNCSVYDNKKGVVDPSEGLLRLNAGDAGKSGRRKICFTDWDDDGRIDLLVDSRSVAWFRNVGSEGDNVSFEYQGDISDVRFAGHSTCPTVFDWGADGIPDVIIGAEDGHFYLLRNGRKN